MDKTSMNYWFPLLEAARLPVPLTKSLGMPPDLCRNILMVLYGEKPESDPREHGFFSELKRIIGEVGTPCFLRTAQTSAKHSWDKSCYLPNINDVIKHVYEIAEFSEIADFCGLPFDQWFVRELLPSIKYGTCPGYDNMPVAKEFRFFVDGPRYICHHPYWPLSALQDGRWEVDADEQTAYTELCELDYHTFDKLKCIASRAGMACGGAWSVDLLETERGWFLTDMAEAHRSFHWEGCKDVLPL